jgi:hypothetical protein
VEPLLDADECGEKVADLPLRQSGALFLHDETYRDLTEPAIRFTNHRGITNLRMLDEDGLELDRRHLVRLVLDDILVPAHDVDGAGGVVVADVSRVDESLRVDGLFRFLGVVQVAFGDAPPMQISPLWPAGSLRPVSGSVILMRKPQVTLPQPSFLLSDVWTAIAVSVIPYITWSFCKFSLKNTFQLTDVNFTRHIYMTRVV